MMANWRRQRPQAGTVRGGYVATERLDEGPAGHGRALPCTQVLAHMDAQSHCVALAAARGMTLSPRARKSLEKQSSSVLNETTPLL